jgi:hypothetical protein
MKIITKVANVLLILFSIYFAANVANSIKMETMRIRETVESENHACESYIVWEISVAVFVAAVLNRGKKVLNTGII